MKRKMPEKPYRAATRAQLKSDLANLAGLLNRIEHGQARQIELGEEPTYCADIATSIINSQLAQLEEETLRDTILWCRKDGLI